MEKQNNTGKLVCVTGASGFIASHVVRELLARGYRVRATVRDAQDSSKIEHLQKIAANAQFPLELFSADLMQPGAFDEAIAECDYVCHVASPVILTAKDPQREIVDVAVQGTNNVFDSISKAKSVKRVIFTSSIAAIIGNKAPGHVYSEADWNEDATVTSNAYAMSKALAEKTAWQRQQSLAKDRNIDLIAINPALVLGPVYTKTHLRSSPAVVRALLEGAYPASPALHFKIVDVHDVANAHVNALEIPSAAGRYILAHEGRWMHEVAQIIKEHFPQSRVSTWRMPNWLMYIVALFDKRVSLSFLRNNLGVSNEIDATKVQRELGIDYYSVEKSIVDTCQSMMDNDFVKPFKTKERQVS